VAVAIKSYRDLEVYRRAKALVVPVHRLVAIFPDIERYGLCDQIRRASKSVVANIVEGYSHKDTPGKAKQYWRNSMGSANEMVEHLETAVDLDYAPPDMCQPPIDEYTIVAKQLNRLNLAQLLASIVQRPLSSIQHPISNFQHLTSNFQSPTSSI